MTAVIDFTDAELRRFAPKMKDFYRRGLLDGKSVLCAAGILDNGQRFSHFMGQFGAETGGGTILRESLTYTTVRAIRSAWRVRASRHTDAWIKANLLKNPVGLGDWAYGGRMGNRKGTSDGYDYRGGGYIQTTGRSAVEHYCELCGLPIRPDILDDPAATLRFACAEWQQSGCNELADTNDLMGISKAINTGSATSGVYPNGMPHREEWFAKAQAIWWDAVPDERVAPAVEQASVPVAGADPRPAPSLNRTSRKIKVTNAAEAGVLGTGITFAALWAFVEQGAQFIKTYGVEMAIGAAFVICVYFAAIKHFTRQDHAAGRYTPSGETR